jgi:simple sugar transport system permease protein
MSEIANLIGLIIGAAIIAGTPVLLAVTGEIVAQRSGIVNLGLDGSMLMGAVASAWTYHSTGSVFLSVMAGLLSGSVLGVIHGVLVVLVGVGMLASGICLFFVGRGISTFWGYPIVGQQFTGVAQLKLPFFSDLPVVGSAFFTHDGLVYIAATIAVGVWYVLFRTHVGLMLRATGENAEVARTEGVPVTAIRLIAAAIGGGLAGIGGAYIVLAIAHTWLAGISDGRGWVAIGLVVLARWNPLFALLIAYLFGAVQALQLNAQAAGIVISPYLLSMLPYLLTIAALVSARFWMRRSVMPAELSRYEG